MSDDAILILAAGKGTRMHSTLPKVMHPLAGKPMLERVLDALDPLGIPITAVVGYGAELIRERFGDRCELVDQPTQLGTGDAARVGIDSLPPQTRRILIVHGDEPLIETETYRQMLGLQTETGARVVLLTAHVEDTRGFGRVVRDWRKQPQALVQESDLRPEQRDLDEVNLGAYVFDADFLRDQVGRLEPHPPKGELYLTDLIAAAAADPYSASGSGPVATVTLERGEEMMGVNTLVHLEQASRLLYRRTNHHLMEHGVTILDSASTFIDDTVWIAPGTAIYPFTIIEGQTRIGSNCRVGPYTHIEASRIGSRCVIRASTVEHSEISDDVTVGPYAHLRPGASIGSGVEIGNYAEIKASRIGERTRMHHMSYVGDAEIGRDVNIGAGVITCNFDGSVKHRTVVEDGAFVGSDTMLRAPVRIGRGAFTGAGSVVTHDVPDGAVVAGVPARPLAKHTEEREDETSEEQA